MASDSFPFNMMVTMTLLTLILFLVYTVTSPLQVDSESILSLTATAMVLLPFMILLTIALQLPWIFMPLSLVIISSTSMNLTQIQPLVELICPLFLQLSWLLTSLSLIKKLISVSSLFSVLFLLSRPVLLQAQNHLYHPAPAHLVL